MINFQKLQVYKKSQNFIKEIYRITKKFPKEERYGLIDQMRRAAVSIAANIAEGSGRFHTKDFAQFSRIARSSAYEVLALLDVSLEQEYITKQEYEQLFKESEDISKMLSGLITHLANRKD